MKKIVIILSIVILLAAAAITIGIISINKSINSRNNQSIIFYKRTGWFGITTSEVFDDDKVFSQALYEKYGGSITQMHVAVGQRHVALTRLVFISDSKLDDETRGAILDDIMAYLLTGGYSLRNDCEVFFCEKERPYCAFVSRGEYNSFSELRRDWEEIPNVEGNLTFKMVKELLEGLRPIVEVWK